MKVIVVHNYYQQPGGEDQVFADECLLLESHGHSVVRYTVHNNEINGQAPLKMAVKTIWNKSSHDEIRDLVTRERADVVHFHNTFPLLSPSVYSGAREAGAAVVQTLHNYRFICPAGTFLRDGHVCEDCLHKAVPWPAVVHKCYRKSGPASAAVAMMLASHRAIGTYWDDVDAYIALSQFAKQKFITAGLPAEKIVVKPNFVSPDPGAGVGGGGYALFVGRLEEAKGISALLQAWKQLAAPVALKIIGDGELAPLVKLAAESDSRIQWLGRRPLAEVYQTMGLANALVFPSIWYEGMPKTIVESFAAGTPVIASNHGAMAEMITEGRTGALFTPGNANELSATVARYFAEPLLLQQMRVTARAEFESQYTADRNYHMLENIYATAMQRHRRQGQSAAPSQAVARPGLELR